MSNRVHSEEKNRPWRMFFIDSENGIEALVTGFERLCSSDAVVVFHRNTLSKKITTQIELGPAPVEWIECVDPGIKNSMDVQIIAELGVRLAKNAFCEAYVISHDKGYAPAIHHLERQSVAEGHNLGIADSIDQAIQQSAAKALSRMESFETQEDLEHAFTLLFGPKRTSDLIKKLTSILSSNQNPTIPSTETATQESVAKNLTCPTRASENASLPSENAQDSRLALPTFYPPPSPRPNRFPSSFPAYIPMIDSSQKVNRER